MRSRYAAEEILKTRIERTLNNLLGYLMPENQLQAVVKAELQSMFRELDQTGFFASSLYFLQTSEPAWKQAMALVRIDIAQHSVLYDLSVLLDRMYPHAPPNEECAFLEPPKEPEELEHRRVIEP